LSVVDGLSARAVSEIQILERSRLGPGSVALALIRWKRTVGRRNIDSLLDDLIGHSCHCCDAGEHRELLEKALSLLGPRARNELWAKVEPLDEILRRRTIHDPHAEPERPWWRQRA
jgi:hypothetical protein